MKMPSVMQHKFSEIPSVEIPRSVFDRTHGYKTTFNAGYLVPFYIDEALPGDTFNVDATLFARLATQIVPIMDNLYLDTFYFFVPNRLIWDNWQKFCGEQTDPDDSTDFTVPQITSSDSALTGVGSLADYFGLPISIAPMAVCSFWFRAYNLIWNEWFRDQNLQDSAHVDHDNGPDDYADYPLLKRGKRHDYFTSCLPWPQKGPGVEIPLGGNAEIVLDPSTGALPEGKLRTSSTGALYVGPDLLEVLATSSLAVNVSDVPLTYDPNGSLVADLSGATAATINSLRQAFQIQRMYERDARGGTRYTEVVRSHFGVVSPDARLQRPEFLGGKSTPIMITPVMQTSETSGTPQGNLAAFATVVSNREGFTKSFTEHGVILGLMMVRADLTYQSGIPRMFSRSTRFDFYWPALAHLGEQAVLNKEIMYTGTGPTSEATFGYQERFAEYRYYASKITGVLRSAAPSSLDIWHLSQDFGFSTPTLNADFIEENPPVDRIIAVNDEPQFIFDSYIKARTVRPMPTYSVPGLIDHF